MVEQKVNLFWVMCGFGISYMLFGLSMISETYTVLSKTIIGWGAVIGGIIFMVFGWYISRKQTKK